jgi:hypothetical protein
VEHFGWGEGGGWPSQVYGLPENEVLLILSQGYSTIVWEVGFRCNKSNVKGYKKED